MARKLGLISSIAALATALFSWPVQASDASFEFLWFGRPFDEADRGLSRRDVKKYREAIEQVVREPCFSNPETNRLELNWESIDTTHDLEVCLFLAAESLRNRSKLIQSLLASGFTEPFVVKQPRQVARLKNIDGKSFVVTATMPLERLPRGFGGVFERLFSYGFGIGVTLDENGKPYHVSTSFNKK